MVAIGRSRRRLRVVGDPPDELPGVLLLEPDAASPTQRWLKERDGKGLVLRCVRDIPALLQLNDAGDFDLLAIDLAMPGAFEARRGLTTRNPWMATLLVTANREPAFLEAAVRARLDGLLFKPVPKAAFIGTVVDLAAEARRRRLKRQKRVLAIGAHPDDIELGCAGALAKHRAQGDALMILTLSRGASGGDTNVRTREARRAAEILGARLEFGELADTQVGEGLETIELIQQAIRDFRPTHVYTHSAQDTHQDHRNVHAATLVAAREAPNVFCYQSPSATVDFRPTLFLDISEHMDAKVKAIEAYRSQIQRRASFGGELAVAAARYWGRFAGYVMAEPMIVVRQRDSW